MSLDIIIPVLNEGATLAGKLDALQPMRQRGARVIVVDGGSTDSTWALARTRADQLLLAPRGRASQMNFGARHSTADTLLFLHADTALPDQTDQLISQAMQGNAVWGRFDVRIDSPHPMLRVVERMMNWRSRLTGIATGDQAMFVRRTVFEGLGGFANQPLMEDIALSSRLTKVAPPACLRPPVVTSGRRWETHGAVRTMLLMWRLRAAYFWGASPALLALRYGYALAPVQHLAALAILAKAPVAGWAKTRLIPLLGARGAARAQRRFTVDTLGLASATQLGSVTLWCAPDRHHRFFQVLVQALQKRTTLVCVDQPAGDLGVRMGYAFAQHFSIAPNLPLLLMGTDCPLLSPGVLQQAANAMVHSDAVLIPAEDGGYVLIGLRRNLPQVFEGIDWSTPAVLAQTRARLRSSGATWQELAPLWDVDEPADWQRLQKTIIQTL